MCDCAGVEIRRNGLVKLLFALLHLVFWIHDPVCDCACLEIQCTGLFKLLIVQVLRYSALVLSSCCLFVQVLRFSAGSLQVAVLHLFYWIHDSVCDCACLEIRCTGHFKLLIVQSLRYSTLVLSGCCLFVQALRFSAGSLQVAALHLVFWIHDSVCDCACLEIQCTGHFMLLIVQLLRYSTLVLSSCCLIVQVLRFSAVISSGCLASAGYLNTWSECACLDIQCTGHFKLLMCGCLDTVHWSCQAVVWSCRCWGSVQWSLQAVFLIVQVLRLSALVSSGRCSFCFT